MLHPLVAICKIINFVMCYIVLHRQLVVIIKEIVGEVREGDNESVNRIKRICKLSVMIIAMLYGSVKEFMYQVYCINDCL